MVRRVSFPFHGGMTGIAVGKQPRPCHYVWLGDEDGRYPSDEGDKKLWQRGWLRREAAMAAQSCGRDSVGAACWPWSRCLGDEG